MNSFKRLICLATLLGTSSIASMVNAATTTWEWDLNPGTTGYSDTTCNGCDTTFSVTDTVGADSTTANLAGYSDTGGALGTEITSGNLDYFGSTGWGLENNNEHGTAPEHAFDNQSGDFDMVLISFDTSIQLTDINFGWLGYGSGGYLDGDFSVVAFTGTGGICTLGCTWGDIAASTDWSTIGNYNNGSTGYYSINAGAVSSQYWLVGAYNSVFGTNGSNVDEGDDAFKIKGFKGFKGLKGNSQNVVVEVPTPASFGILLMGALFTVARRRKAKPGLG